MRMKNPITYYGGKQKLAKKIVSLFPEHELYAEPFFGGGAVFWEKEASRVEVINDTNRELINFYKVIKHDFPALQSHIRISLHSRDIHRRATVIYNNPDMFSEVKRAWAVWVLSNQSFAAKIDGTWGYDVKSNSVPKKLKNKRDDFTEDHAIRLQLVQIECTDAIRIIQSRDRENSFFYCDPPYYNSDCGHYDGYSLDDFRNLLEVLSQIKGKFILSSYPSPVLKEYTKREKWDNIAIEQIVSVARKKTNQKKKTEMITANFPLSK